MGRSGILVKLREISDQLSEAEARACIYVLGNPEFVMNHALQVVAGECGSSDATIIRLCRKVGLSGYQELRLALAQEHVGRGLTVIHEDVDPEDAPAALLSKVFGGFVNALQDTLRVIDERQFADALEVIGSAKSLSFFGSGASGSVAQNAYFRFQRLGIPCYVSIDSSAQLNRVAMMRPGDVLVAISHSGTSRDIVFAVECAREHGATCIAVTQFGQHPLAKVSELVLHTSSAETAFRSEAMASRVAQQALIDALFVGAAFPRYETVLAALDESRRLTDQLHQ